MKTLSLSAGYLSAAILVAASQASFARDTVTPPVVDLKGEFSEVAQPCFKVFPDALITPDHMRLARERWKDDPEALQDEAFLKQWALDNFKLLGSVLDLPDLTAHPLAGRKVNIQLLSQDYLDQIGRSEAVQCVLPERTYFNPANNELSDIRGDIAEALHKFSVNAFLDGQYQQIVQQYDDFLGRHKEEILNPDTVKMLMDIRSDMDQAKDSAAMGNILDQIWAVMMVLEEDHLTPAARKIIEAQEKFHELLEEQFQDPDNIKDFNQDAFEAMDEFLKEQIEKAKEAGDEELAKKLEEMRQQLQEMREQMQQRPQDQQDAWKMQEMMQQMQKMMQTPGMSQEQMQQMMQQMMQKMQDQKTMQELQEMLEKQRELMDETNMSEEDRQEMLDSMRETLEGFSDQMKERAEEAERRLREEIEKQKEQGAEVDAAENERILNELKELGKNLERTIQDKQGETADTKKLETLEELESRLRETMERLSTDQPKKPDDLQRALEEMKGISRELERMDRFPLNTSPEESPQDADAHPPEGSSPSGEQTPPDAENSPKAGDPDGGDTQKELQERLEQLERQLEEAREATEKRDGETREMGQDANDLRQLQRQIDSIKQQLQQEDLKPEDVQEIIEKLKDIQSEIAEREEADIGALQQGMLQLIAQLESRVDVVGGKEYIKESSARIAGATDVAETHDANQRLVMGFGEELEVMSRDIRERLQKESPMTEEEALRTIQRLEEIQTELDRLDPPDPNEQNQQQDGQQGQQQQPQQPQKQPHELMEMLQRLMRQKNEGNQQQQQMQQMMDQMQQRMQQMQQRQEQMQQQMEQLRKQLEEMGMDPDKIEETIQKMREAGEQLQQGQPSQAMPGQGQAIENMDGMLQQMMQQIPMPGQGQGPGPGQGSDSSDGKSTDKPFARDIPRESEIDPDSAKNNVIEFRDRIRERLERNDLPPTERLYLEKLLRQGAAPQPVSP